ncbi:MAG: hypothetical protein J0H73_13480, partial [Salana multivorans]|nr:hypothetical protein [Salana multivorans]
MTTGPTSFDERYRAVETRDARFDGQFVTAVLSTGIYCRPSCPARTPKPANVAFYPTSFNERYRAVETRDARFDGQFVT